MGLLDRLATKAADVAVRAGLFCVETVLEKADFFGENEKPVQKQLELAHTGQTATSQKIPTGAIQMSMSPSTTHYSASNHPFRVRERRGSRYITSTAASPVASWPKRDHRIIRHYLGSAAYPQRVIEDLLTEEEVRERCISPEACSMTCTSKAGKRRTRRLGHWFDTFEKYR